MKTQSENIQAAADRIEAATDAGIPCQPITDLIGHADIDLAYQVQQELTKRRVSQGARRVGRKIGLTAPAVQAQIGVDRPDFGVLFDDMRFEDGDTVPIERLLQPKAEAEVAFLLGEDILDASDPAAVRRAVALAFPALEIVDSRIADWRIGITDTVADNASSGVYVIGTQGLSLEDFEPSEAEMSLLQNGRQVSTGDGKACLGDPLNALSWLAATAVELGDPLVAGDVVLSGALGPMVEVHPGDEFIGTIGALGTITARFSQKDQT